MSDHAIAPGLLLGGVESSVDVLRIDDREEARATLLSVVAGARREARSMLPAADYSVGVLRSSWEVDRALLARGVDGRVLYHASSARPPDVLAYMTELADAGAQIRVAARVPGRLVVVDRAVAVVSVSGAGLAPYLLVREPAVVRSLDLQFDALWDAGHSVGTGPHDTLNDQGVREVLELLRSGASDRTAARKLGVSDRTIRRRVAAVMELLGASSRFEAGAKAARAGWV